MHKCKCIVSEYIDISNLVIQVLHIESTTKTEDRKKLKSLSLKRTDEHEHVLLVLVIELDGEADDLIVCDDSLILISHLAPILVGPVCR